jgi:cellulose synthase/poly-beta-1,6-N-acetylglucosamine synthase-like glycosyltransferase
MYLTLKEKYGSKLSPKQWFELYSDKFLFVLWVKTYFFKFLNFINLLLTLFIIILVLIAYINIYSFL